MDHTVNDVNDGDVIPNANGLEVWCGPDGGGLVQVLTETSLNWTSAGDGLRVGVRPGASWSIDDTVLVGGPLPTSFDDDFSDGNYTANPAWNASGSWSASGGEMYNAVLDTNWRSFWRSDVGHADGVLKFTYTLRNGVGIDVDPRLIVRVRNDSWDDCVKLHLREEQADMAEVAGGTPASLDANTAADSTLDQAYDVTVRLDGDRIEVWQGQAGQTQSRILSTSSATVLDGGGIAFTAPANCLVTVDNVDFSVPDPAVTTYAYDTANELTAVTEDGLETYYSYDAWGRTSSKWRGDGTSVHAEYTWFAGDKLKRIDSTFPGEEARVSFNYDGLGKRRNKYVNTTDLTWYRWAGWNVIADYTGDGSWTVGARTMSYTPGLAQAPGANPTTAAYQYSMADHLGSVRQITAQDKSVLAHYAYTPYGETDFAAGLAMTHGFTGHRWDAETGLYFAPFRYYAPQNARWMKRDPLGFVDAFNRYIYVQNTPLMLIDPLGLDDDGCALLKPYWKLGELIYGAVAKVADILSHDEGKHNRVTDFDIGNKHYAKSKKASDTARDVVNLYFLAQHAIDMIEDRNYYRRMDPEDAMSSKYINARTDYFQWAYDAGEALHNCSPQPSLL